MGTRSHDACPGRVHCVACEVILSSFQCRDTHLWWSFSDHSSGQAETRSSPGEKRHSGTSEVMQGRRSERTQPSTLPQEGSAQSARPERWPSLFRYAIVMPSCSVQTGTLQQEHASIALCPTCLSAIPQKKLQGAGSHDLSMKMPQCWQLIAAAGQG